MRHLDQMRVSRVFGRAMRTPLIQSATFRRRVDTCSLFFSTSAWPPPTVGTLAVRACVDTMLDQQRALLTTLDDAQYVFHSPLVDGSVGGHTRHALDHLRKPLETWLANDATIRYDRRARQTDVERVPAAALAQIDEIRTNLHTIDNTPNVWGHTVDAAFMLSGDGHEFAFASTMSRELAFAVHHAIHHNALIKILMRHHFPQVALPEAFGLAPSTINFNSSAATTD